jgi:hypothetical protein
LPLRVNSGDKEGGEARNAWTLQENGGMSANVIDDPIAIDRLRNEELTLVQTDRSGWTMLYRDNVAGRFWELDYPRSEMHGGGPVRLRELDINTPEDWEFSN